MTSADVFYGIGDGLYWLFQNTLEPIGEIKTVKNNSKLNKN